MAELASEEQTGARSLVSVAERVLLKFEKTLPSRKIDAFTVSLDVVEDPVAGLSKLLGDQQVTAFRASFEKAYGITVTFEEEALDYLVKLAEEEGLTVDRICEERFGDFGHGLKLLGKPSIVVTLDAAQHPKQHLDNLVKSYYAQS
jgi:hypothetical protein